MHFKENNRKKKIFFIIFIFCIFIVLISVYKNKNTINNIIGISEEVSLYADYSAYKEIGQNAKISSVAITETTTGVGPFDDETTTDSSNSDGSVTWTAGDDWSEDDNIVRSFDQITWTVESNFSLKDGKEGSYKGGVIYIEANVPSDLADLVEWDLDSMVWAENAEITDNGTKMTAYYTMTEDDITVPGKQDLVLILKVYGASNGTEITPSFNISLYGNAEADKVSITGNKIYVSAAPSYNIKLVANSSSSGGVRSTVTINDEEVSGRLVSYYFVLQLYNSDSNKGLKGIEYPKGDITFSIDLLFQRISTTSGNTEDITDDASLMLWEYGIAESDVSGVPYGVVSSDRSNSIYDSGDVIMKQDGNTINVTVSDYSFDGIFPKYNAYYLSTTSVVYGENIGCFNSTEFKIFVPDTEANSVADMNYYLTVSDSNFSATSLSETTTSAQKVTTDDLVKFQYVKYKSGTYSHHLDITGNSSITDRGRNGTTALMRGETFTAEIYANVTNNSDEEGYIYDVNKLFKFDGEGFEIVSISNIKSGMTFNIWYLTKTNGTNWESQTEMNETVDLESFNLYENLSDIPEDELCIGIFFESTSGVWGPTYNAISIKMRVRDTANVNQTYGMTQATYIWDYEDKLDRSIYTYNNNGNTTYPDPTWKIEKQNYVKTEYDENGQIVSGTHNGSYYYGNTVLVTGGELAIEISSITEDTGEEKINYDFSKNEYDAVYEITPSISSSSAATGINLKIEVTLPVGLTYVGGSSNEEYGEPEITENEDGTTTLVWYVYNATSGEAITPITYTAHIDEESENGTQYETTVVVSEYVSDGETYKIGNSQVSNRTYTYDIQVINLSSYSFYKTTETPVIEIDGVVHYKITALNNTDNNVSGFQLLDILPYNGDERGTSFNGTYTVSQIVITQTNTSTSESIDNELDLYVTADESVRSGITANDEDLGTTYIWKEASSEKALNEELTALAVTGTLVARERLEVDIYIKTEGNEPYDVYKNSATAQTSTETEAMETSIITVQDVKRSIEGYVWYDENGDGLISNGEEYLSGVTVTLLNSDGTTAKDVSGNEIESTTTNENGYYEFEDMAKGDYIVQFQSATEIKGVNYEFTSKETGSNVEINSKVDSSGTTDIITTLNSVESPVITESYVNAGIKMTDAEIASSITKTGVVVENEEETAIATLSLDEEANESDVNSEKSENTGNNTSENNTSISNENSTENSLTENSTGNRSETTTGNTTSNGNETEENTSTTESGETTGNDTNIQSNGTTENNQSGTIASNESGNVTNQSDETNSSGTESGSTENSASENETNSSNSESTTTANETTSSGATGTSESSFTYSLTTTALGEEEEDTNTLTKESQSMMYTINYTTKVKDYIGTATVTIVDTLPYELEDGYTYTVTLNGETVNVTAVYDEENKTLTWEIPIENIYTYETTDTKVIDGNISIEIILYLKYKDIDYEQDSLTNTVTGDIYLEETEQEDQVEDEATTNIDLNLIDIKVTKNWDDDSDNLGIRPSEISITLTATANGTTYSLDGITTTTIILKSTSGWSYTWEDLPKYDSSGNTINYEITENLSEEQQIIYTVTVEQDTANSSKLLASYIITNKYVGNTEYENIIVNKVWQGDTVKTEDGDGNEVEEVSSSRPTEATVILSATVNEENYDITGFTTELEVTLTENESWTHTWENLPKYTATGQEVEYTVQETSTFEDYYLSSITSDTTVDGEITYTVINSKYGSITLTKVDKTDKITKLGGATFKLEKLLEENEEYIVDESFEAIILTTASDTESNDFGTLTFGNLEYGTYVITETKAPEGYNLSTDTLTVTVDSENAETSVTATDKKKKVLPVTGENGVFYIIIVGAVLVIIGIKTGKIKIWGVKFIKKSKYKSKH